MISKSITYTDFNGETTTEEFLFHLNKAELAQIQFTAGDMEKKLAYLQASNKRGELLTWFKDIMLMAYGVRSEDGRAFIKTPEVRQGFEYSNAFAELFFEILSNPHEAMRFIAEVGGVPSDSPEMQEILKKYEASVAVETKDVDA